MLLQVLNGLVSVDVFHVPRDDTDPSVLKERPCKNMDEKSSSILEVLNFEWFVQGLHYMVISLDLLVPLDLLFLFLPQPLFSAPLYL